MAKETKTQFQERMAREETALWAKFKQEYPVRFMSLLYAFMDAEKSGAPFGVIRDVDELGYFRFKSNQGWKEVFELYMPGDEYDRDLVENVLGAERALVRYQDEVAESRRRASLRVTALAKLTKEEQELLGL